MIGEFPLSRRNDTLPFFDATFRNQFYSNKRALDYLQGAFLEDVASFDAAFFKLSPVEAQLTDPAQRLYLECAMKAVENAGYGGRSLNGTRTGVYVGYMPDQRPFNYRDLALHFSDFAVD